MYLTAYDKYVPRVKSTKKYQLYNTWYYRVIGKIHIYHLAGTGHFSLNTSILYYGFNLDIIAENNLNYDRKVISEE